MTIIIDEKIDKHECPGIMFCTIATTFYDEIERQHICYLCWKNYCKYNNIEIGYKE